MGKSLPRRTIHDAMETNKVVEKVYKPSEVTRRSYEILYEVCEEENVPVDPNKIGVAEVKSKKPYWYGGAVAYGCGEYQYGVDGWAKWTVEKTPKGYIILLNRRKAAMDPDHHETTLRHELAHIVNFETEGYTVEQEGIHSEWMDKLDAWD